jgi:hypothetical protein
MTNSPTYVDLGPDPEPLGVRADLLLGRIAAASGHVRPEAVRSSPHDAVGFRPMETGRRRHTVEV